MPWSKDWKVLGYWESDFLGQTGNPPNGGLAVSSNPYVFRMRLYWVDVTQGKFEFLAGQSWSLMTPNRKGISPLPGDIFYSQDIDVNYQSGLVWGRIPGIPASYSIPPTRSLSACRWKTPSRMSAAETAAARHPPGSRAARTRLGRRPRRTDQQRNQRDFSSAALAPDIIAKLAFDPSSKFHFEFAGVEIANKIAYPGQHPCFPDLYQGRRRRIGQPELRAGKNFRILTNNYWSAGGGRYIFGQAPDFIIRANGSLSLVHSGIDRHRL